MALDPLLRLLIACFVLALCAGQLTVAAMKSTVLVVLTHIDDNYGARLVHNDEG